MLINRCKIILKTLALLGAYFIVHVSAYAQSNGNADVRGALQTNKDSLATWRETFNLFSYMHWVFSIVFIIAVVIIVIAIIKTMRK